MKTKAVLDLTLKIQNQFPALYEHLDEAPVYISQFSQSVSQDEVDAYYQSLKAQTAGLVKSLNWR